MTDKTPTNTDWQVYLLRCADNTLYCGITNNLPRRLRQHNGEMNGGAKYTQGRRPCQLAYCEHHPDKSQALKREQQIKHYTRPQKESLCSKLVP
ncbi:GIY-YIG nuclease family protein [Hydrogenovibrio halophilus]|uniref:GIY-YIG nuclease family protein n=1 Tax=Hydrogenovibrio halophilus TaxID=373391 RepID=UPI0003645A51|nr:GIY-YIG nuclease family protein [Hydrogenovibrio halophilus]